MKQHQRSSANMNKKLLLLLNPTGSCSSTSTNWLVQQHQHQLARAAAEKQDRRSTRVGSGDACHHASTAAAKLQPPQAP
jgi:hypothetical protein